MIFEVDHVLCEMLGLPWKFIDALVKTVYEVPHHLGYGIGGLSMVH